MTETERSAHEMSCRLQTQFATDNAELALKFHARISAEFAAKYAEAIDTRKDKP